MEPIELEMSSLCHFVAFNLINGALASPVSYLCIRAHNFSRRSWVLSDTTTVIYIDGKCFEDSMTTTQSIDDVLNGTVDPPPRCA